MRPLDFKDPRKILAGLRWIEENLPLDELSQKARNLRTRGMRPYLEARQAALFSYGMSEVLMCPVAFALSEERDYDIIVGFKRDGAQHFVPVQLKEVVPEELNPHTSIQAEIDKLRKYADSKDLVVVIHLNRRGKLNVADLAIPQGLVAEIWIVAGANQEMTDWLLIGNLLDEKCYTYKFSYPLAELPEGFE